MNRAGAAGTVGAAEVARAKPDGYTIGILTSTPLLMKPHTTKLPYTLASFDLVCHAFDNPLILPENAKSKIKTFADLLKYVGQHPHLDIGFIFGPITIV